jgi:hypothetical protein
VNELEADLDKTTETATEALEKINSATNPARKLVVLYSFFGLNSLATPT